ncbi:MAG: hypothetical protein APF80_02595 [Alphaproteobacteria bacterium BRH_c36]|nr:MAG: hypothetical protein APF80_02595 [Alphaproteobacteria bacterium BRH_c36]
MPEPAVATVTNATLSILANELHISILHRSRITGRHEGDAHVLSMFRHGSELLVETYQFTLSDVVAKSISYDDLQLSS